MGGGLIGNSLFGLKKIDMSDYANAAGYGASTTATEIAMKQQSAINQMVNNAAQMQVNPMMIGPGTVTGAQMYPTPKVKPAPAEPQFKVVKIRNGYLLHHAPTPWADFEQDYCADMNEVGQRVTALLVQYMLQEEK